MDLVTILLWFLVFSVIVLFLGALTYFLGRPNSNIVISEKKSQTDTINQQQPPPQSNRSNTNNNRRKHARNANKKQRQEAAAVAANANLNSNTNDEDQQETKPVTPEIKIEKESSAQSTDEEEEEQYEEPMQIEEVLIPSPPTPIEQEPLLPVKQRHKHKSNHTNSKLLDTSSSNTTNLIPSSKEESILPTKPQASVTPVKQPSPTIVSTNIDSTQIPQDNNSKLNGKISSSYNIYPHSGHNSLPPRFQQQRQQKEAENGQKFRKRRTTSQKQSSLSPSKQQINNNNQLESSNQNGYSSESDILSESPSTTNSTVLSTCAESQFSLNRIDLIESLSKSNLFLDKLVSIFDTTSFSSDELELILNKINSKHSINKPDWQHLLSSVKNDKTLEHILDETYRSQVKILAIELQSEKHRVLELTKTNAEMDTTIRQLQQPNNNMLPYQQTILSYQMQIRRVTDENARLVHQLHAFSIMPASINELKQQQHILNEQLRQLTFRNNTLEQEVSDGDRASKHAAEIYKKADTQKQERIEQMLADLNRYKKIDKDLLTLRQKHAELEKNLNSKLTDLTNQRDDLQKSYDELKEKVQQYEQIKIKYDQLIQSPNHQDLQQELNEVKAKNDLLRQRNWKIIEQLNKLTHEREQNQKNQSS